MPSRTDSLLRQNGIPLQQTHYPTTTSGSFPCTYITRRAKGFCRLWVLIWIVSMMFHERIYIGSMIRSDGHVRGAAMNLATEGNKLQSTLQLSHTMLRNT